MSRWAELRASLLGPRLFESDAPRPDPAWVDAQRDALLAYVEGLPESPRLGVRFERAFEAYFACHPDYTLLASNFPVRDGGQTLGAADLLIGAGREVLHIELAVKFYAATHGVSSRDPFGWLGPNANDSLGRKWTRMRDHQLGLLGNEVGRRALRQAGLEAPTRRAALMHGVLFFPHDAASPRPLPEGVSKEASVGRWVPAGRARDILPEGRFLPRSAWISGDPGPVAEVPSAPYQWLAADAGRWLVLPDAHPVCRGGVVES